MVDLRSGVKAVNAAEMVNFCMVTAMNSEPLAWDSEELAALTAYVENIRPAYVPRAPRTGANPCNPCGADPGGNPCGGR
jgi:cytochrome c